MFKLSRKDDAGNDRCIFYTIHTVDWKYVCTIENAVSHCCKLSTLCNYTGYGFFNDAEKVKSLFTFLEDNKETFEWDLNIVMMVSAPENREYTKELFKHPNVIPMAQMDRFSGSSTSGKLDFYTVRFA